VRHEVSGESIRDGIAKVETQSTRMVVFAGSNYQKGMGMNSRLMLAGVALAGLVACGSTNMTKTGPEYASRGESCSFDILTATPAQGFVEIGTVDVTPGLYGDKVFRELRDFKEEIHPQVCAAGGDAAIAIPNGYGAYIKATVLKRVAPPPDIAGARRPAAPAPAPASGCQFDTQCKGDRVCVKGECVAPPARDSSAQ
jgi:hypothetical protein